MIRKLILIPIVGFFYFNQTISAVNLRKVATFESNKVFSANVHAGHDMTNLFFRPGQKDISRSRFHTFRQL
ncbi:MAG: hypothetical protein KBA66_13190 [Leptospiraceae bacterium]|nr:hypothetical protein [Leptospiraceae bacterium]